MKTVHILVGPKGSGKTHIGTVLQQELGLRFLRVESIWLSLAPEEDGWKKVEMAIDHELTDVEDIIIESLGAGEGFNGLRESLAKKYRLRFIKVSANLDECLRRVRTRNSAEHIPVSDEQVERYNAIAALVQHPWSAVIDNNTQASKSEIVRAFQARIDEEQDVGAKTLPPAPQP